MNTYNFVVARFVPDLIRNEPVNVGIIVNDSKTYRSFGRFVENFRPLISRYKDCNIAALKTIIETVRGEYELESNESLEILSKNSQYQLRFTEPRAIRSEDHLQAIESLYKRYISIESAN